jgi:DNA-binding beta-propeller fold protein YncE
MEPTMRRARTSLASAESLQVPLLVGLTAALAVASFASGASGQIPSGSLVLEKIGGTAPGTFDEAAAEISAWDAASQRLFTTNADTGAVDVLDLSDPTQPRALPSIDVTPFGHHPNSVAVRGGLLAVAVENDPKSAPGAVVFFDANGQLRGGVPVDSQPDMLTFSPNGRWLVVANEGEPESDYSVDPPGSISIIPVKGDVGLLTAADVVRVGFESLDTGPLPAGLRISGPSPLPSQDIEPEYVTISGNSRTAFVTLQENNAIAVVDLRKGELLAVLPMGTKDHSLPGFGLDASDKDNAIAIGNWPVRGLYASDSVAWFRTQGKGWLITANEGDTRDWDAFSDEARVSTLSLDPVAFPDATIKNAAKLGRLVVSEPDGDVDDDGDHDVLYAFGGRSVSIRSDDGALAWDSGDLFEQMIAAGTPAEFNADNTANASFDTRSDNKGPEPEGLTVARLFGRTWAFVGLERQGGIVALDVSDPLAPELAAYVNTRDYAGDPESGTAGDLGPEGLLVIPAHESPTGEPLLVVSFEVSGSVGVFRIAEGAGG